MYDMRVGNPTYTPLLCPSLRPFPKTSSKVFIAVLSLITTYHTFVLHIMSSHYNFFFHQAKVQ